MRFCLASTQADWGGGEKLLWSIRTALLDQGHSVTWIIRRDQPLHERIKVAGDAVLSTLTRPRSQSARMVVGRARSAGAAT